MNSKQVNFFLAPEELPMVIAVVNENGGVILIGIPVRKINPLGMISMKKAFTRFVFLRRTERHLFPSNIWKIEKNKISYLGKRCSKEVQEAVSDKGKEVIR